jgi:hypothetical protein
MCNQRGTARAEVLVPSSLSSPPGVLCASCRKPGADHACFPCRHLCACAECAAEIQQQQQPPRIPGDSDRRDDEAVHAVMRCPHCHKEAESCAKMFF